MTPTYRVKQALLGESTWMQLKHTAHPLILNSAKSSGTGGTATEQSDTQNATAKAKKDHPEAPDVVIGMQDERGGKGA